MPPSGREFSRCSWQSCKAHFMRNILAHPEQPDEYLTADSVAFHTRLGYQTAGQLHFCGYKFGRWYHTVLMEKHLGPHLPQQQPVRPFEEIRARCSL